MVTNEKYQKEWLREEIDEIISRKGEMNGHM